MITVSDERKSTRIVLRDDGKDVFSASVDYSKRNICLMLDMFDPEYCASHIDEVQEALTAFISKANGLLTEANLPIICNT